jgi:MFS family permease
LFGVAEAGAFPGSARVFYNWLPAQVRGIANGILFSGALLGGGLAFPLRQWLLDAYGWRLAFYLLGVPGLAWALSWLIWFRDYPATRIVDDVSAVSRIPIPQCCAKPRRLAFMMITPTGVSFTNAFSSFRPRADLAVSFRFRRQNVAARRRT